MFTLANFTADPVQRQWMMQKKTYELAIRDFKDTVYPFFKSDTSFLKCV